MKKGKVYILVVSLICLLIMITITGCSNDYMIRNEWIDLVDGQTVVMAEIFTFEWDSVLILVSPGYQYDLTDIFVFDPKLRYIFSERICYLVFFINEDIVHVSYFLPNETHPHIKEADTPFWDQNFYLKRDEAVFRCIRDTTRFVLYLSP